MPLDHNPFHAEDEPEDMSPKKPGRPRKGASSAPGGDETDSGGDSTSDDEE